MPQERTRNTLVVSRRLVIFAALSLIATGIVFGLTFYFGQRLMLSWLSFECDIIGGFVSIQQRLAKVGDEELQVLAQSWAAILVIPIYGGIFALTLYVLFLSGLVQGHLFPEFHIPAFADPPTSADIVKLLKQTYPKSGPDFAKLLFWTFVAGFSERFVPQIIQSVSGRAGGGPRER